MPLWASGYHLQLASTALVSAMFALSLQLLVGGGRHGEPRPRRLLRRRRLCGPPAAGGALDPAHPAGRGARLAAAAALPIGALSLRTRGFFFLMTTLAFGQMLFFLFHDTPLGGGKDGVFVTRPALEAFGAALEVPRRSRPTVLLLLNLGVLVAMYAGLAALMRTLFGHALRGIRANENRMRALGYDIAARQARRLRAGRRAGRGRGPHVGHDRGLREPRTARLAPLRRRAAHDPAGRPRRAARPAARRRRLCRPRRSGHAADRAAAAGRGARDPRRGAGAAARPRRPPAATAAPACRRAVAAAAAEP